MLFALQSQSFVHIFLFKGNNRFTHIEAMKVSFYLEQQRLPDYTLRSTERIDVCMRSVQSLSKIE